MPKEKTNANDTAESVRDTITEIIDECQSDSAIVARLTAEYAIIRYEIKRLREEHFKTLKAFTDEKQEAYQSAKKICRMLLNRWDYNFNSETGRYEPDGYRTSSEKIEALKKIDLLAYETVFQELNKEWVKEREEEIKEREAKAKAQAEAKAKAEAELKEQVTAGVLDAMNDVKTEKGKE